MDRHLMLLEKDKPCSIRKTGTNRYAITSSEMGKVTGHVLYSPNSDTWTVKYKGKIVPVLYSSLGDAVEAILVLYEGSQAQLKVDEITK